MYNWILERTSLICKAIEIEKEGGIEEAKERIKKDPEKYHLSIPLELENALKGLQGHLLYGKVHTGKTVKIDDFLKQVLGINKYMKILSPYIAVIEAIIKLLRSS